MGKREREEGEDVGDEGANSPLKGE